MVYNKHDWQDGELITSGKLNNIEDGIYQSILYTNVKYFGAVGDGIHDDTQAFSDAIGSSGSTIFVPNGTYLLSKSLLLQQKNIIGENKQNTVIKFTGSSNAIKIVYQNKISDLTIDVSGAKNGISAIEVGATYDDKGSEQYAAGSYNHISNINITSSIENNNTVAIFLSPKLLKDFDNNAIGCFKNYFEDVTIRNIGIGFYMDAQKNGWINANVFNSVSILGYNKYALWMGSSNTESQGLVNNSFDSLVIQTFSGGDTNKCAIHFQGINNNSFTNISHWNDSGSQEKSVKVIEFFADQKGSYYTTVDNVITGKIEGLITGDERLINSNDINLSIIDPAVPVSIYYSHMSNMGYEKGKQQNLLPSDFINLYKIQPRLSNALFYGSDNGSKFFSVKDDNYGSYISVDNDPKGNRYTLTLFGKILKSIKSSSLVTFSIILSGDTINGNVDFSLSGFNNNGSSADLSSASKNVIIERFSDGSNRYSINATYDFIGNNSIISNLKNMTLYTIIRGNSGTITKIYNSSVSNTYANHNNRIVDNHTGVPVSKIIPDGAKSWADLDIDPLDLSNFQSFSSGAYTVSQLDTGKLIETKYKE